MQGKYWNKLKQRLVSEGNETVTSCHQLKLRAATEISPSLRYYLLLEYCKQKGNNVPAGIKPHIDAVNKEIKDVIRFPKVAKGISNGVKK